MDQAPASKKREIIAALSVLIVIVVIVAAVVATNKKTTVAATETANKTVSTATTSQVSTTAAVAGSTFKNGDYTATGTYSSPGGNESLTVALTVKDDVVTDSTVTSGATDPEAKEYQSDFISAYKTQVVGKKLADITVSRVAGSSLTSQGFNTALQKIEAAAKA